MDFEHKAQKRSIRHQAGVEVSALGGKGGSDIPLPRGQRTCCGEELRPFWAEDGRLISVCKRCGKEIMDQFLVRYGGSPWIGVDLDGTLSEDVRRDGGYDLGDEIGDPIEPMLKRVKAWLAEGKTVKIFTARASVPRQVERVKRWMAQHGLPDLEVTNTKDFGMIELWDDRCVQVARNVGEPTSQAGKTVKTRHTISRRRTRRESSVGFFSKIRMYLAL